jgi:hypothetical protein
MCSYHTTTHACLLLHAFHTHAAAAGNNHMLAAVAFALPMQHIDLLLLLLL